MTVKEMYLDSFISLYDTLFEEDVEINDKTGIYYFPKIDMQVKSWNRLIERCNRSLSDNQLTNLIKFMIQAESYWFEEVEEESEEQQSE